MYDYLLDEGKTDTELREFRSKQEKAATTGRRNIVIGSVVVVLVATYFVDSGAFQGGSGGEYALLWTLFSFVYGFGYFYRENEAKEKEDLHSYYAALEKYEEESLSQAGRSPD